MVVGKAEEMEEVEEVEEMEEVGKSAACHEVDQSEHFMVLSQQSTVGKERKSAVNSPQSVQISFV
jgi:hypothetical protein